MTIDHKTSSLLTFVLGAAVGAVTALLLAPKAGAKLRGDIAAGADRGVRKARSTAHALKRRTQKIVDVAQQEIDAALKEAQNSYSQAK